MLLIGLLLSSVSLHAMVETDACLVIAASIQRVYLEAQSLPGIEGGIHTLHCLVKLHHHILFRCDRRSHLDCRYQIQSSLASELLADVV